MKDFADLRDGGRQLGERLVDVVASLTDPVLVPVVPNGVPVVLGVREHLTLPVLPLMTHRSDDGVVVDVIPALAGRTAVVIDDGVETGTVARAAVPALRASGVARLVLAVPVCPREARADLALRYDDVVSVAAPLVRRSLAWHYEDFDTIDEAEALRLLQDLGA